MTWAYYVICHQLLVQLNNLLLEGFYKQMMTPSRDFGFKKSYQSYFEALHIPSLNFNVNKNCFKNCHIMYPSHFRF